ncbi:hypothetical protein I5U73_00415 [Stenotrophomonas maltophilia]|nr:hypothetical protein [Stenotrophomonas maltophilia]
MELTCTEPDPKDLHGRAQSTAQMELRSVGLSSNSVIHFTKKKESLFGILQEGFKVKYCREEIILDGFIIKLHIPMISFCDIPFSKIKDHVSKYGGYGIGLSREWAIKNRLNPVLYIQGESSLAQSYRDLVGLLYHKETEEGLDQEFRRKAKDIARYIKNYEGPLTVDGVHYPKYRFSDEREWRYVPEFSDAFHMMYTSDQFADETSEVANSKVAHIRVDFSPDDVKYIIIKDDEEISEIAAHVTASHSGNYTVAQQQKLMTRIITAEQIRTDF